MGGGGKIYYCDLSTLSFPARDITHFLISIQDHLCQKKMGEILRLSHYKADLLDQKDLLKSLLSNGGPCETYLKTKNGALTFLKQLMDSKKFSETEFLTIFLGFINQNFSFPSGQTMSLTDFMLPSSLKIKGNLMQWFLKNSLDLKVDSVAVVGAIRKTVLAKALDDLSKKSSKDGKHVIFSHTPTHSSLQHYTPIMLETRNGKCNVLISDSLGIQDFLEVYYEQIKKSLPHCKLFVSNVGRQADPYTCPMYSLSDAKSFANDDGGLFSKIESTNPVFNKSKGYHEVSCIPPEMMRIGQSYSKISSYVGNTTAQEAYGNLKSVDNTFDKTSVKVKFKKGDKLQFKPMNYESRRVYNELLMNFLEKEMVEK